MSYGVFNTCKMCDKTNDDVCDFRLWQKTDNKDQKIEDYIVVCRDKECMKNLDDAKELYIQVSWGEGRPGIFMLICGDCKHRNEWECTHKDLTKNGGGGLEVRFSGLQMHVCGSDGCRSSLGAASYCAGKEKS